MEHILDNPIWNALLTGSKYMANGDEQAKYVNRDAGAFAGLKENSETNLLSLHEQTPLETPVVLFVPSEIHIPSAWEVILQKPLLQLVYLRKDPPSPRTKLTMLTEKDVPAMLSLTALTKPGPFLPRTIDFGNYKGIFDGDQLVAMAGHRLQPTPYVEISAVCTHPDYVGRGYAASLISSQIHDILDRDGIPFLHVLPENASACNLYRKLGFELRKEIMFYVLKREVSFD